MPTAPFLTTEQLQLLLEKIALGTLSAKQGLQNLSPLLAAATAQATTDHAGLNLDHARCGRTGQPETVFALGKSNEQLALALHGIMQRNAKALATRVSPEQGLFLTKKFPHGSYWPEANLFSLGHPLPKSTPHPQTRDVFILTAGAADLPIALEALGTLHFHDIKAGLAPDVGVAGIHRLMHWLPALHAAKALIVVAGMEGALPSVVAGLVPNPVLAVPSSVGYGVSAGGTTALHAMLASCAPGISVCNIDNGYGAAMSAIRIVQHQPHAQQIQTEQAQTPTQQATQITQQNILQKEQAHEQTVSQKGALQAPKKVESDPKKTISFPSLQMPGKK